jgi:hypothetical protein
MTVEELEQALRAFASRRRFRPFLIEFTSGDRILVSHPEAIRRYQTLFLYSGTDGGYRIFAPAQVCQLLDQPPRPPAR